MLHVSLHSDKRSGSVGQTHGERDMLLPVTDCVLCFVLVLRLFLRLASKWAQTMSVVTLDCSLGYHCDPRPCPDIHDRISRSLSKLHLYT